MGRSVILGRQSRPIPRGGGASVSPFLRTHTYAQTVWPKSTKFGMVAQELVSKGSARPQSQGGGTPASPEILGPPATYAKTVWLRATKFDKITQMSCWGSNVFVGRQSCPIPRGGTPLNFWDLLHARTQYEKQQPGDQTKCENYFTGSTTEADERSVCGS